MRDQDHGGNLGRLLRHHARRVAWLIALTGLASGGCPIDDLTAGPNPSVAIDSVGPGAVGASGHLVSSLSWSHTVGPGADSLLVVGSSGNCEASVAYSGIPMTLVKEVADNGRSPSSTQLFYLVAPPPGSHNVTVTYTNCTSDIEAGSISFFGVNQAVPIRNAATSFGVGTSAVVTVDSAKGDMVVDVVGNGSAIQTSQQTLRWMNNQNGSSAAGNAAGSTAPGAAQVTMGYATTKDFWGIVAADVVAAGYRVSVGQSDGAP